jgi:hypothetical protein
MTELLHGWIDGGVEPDDGCRAVVEWSNVEMGDLMHYDQRRKLWRSCWSSNTMPMDEVFRYFSIPPHNKMMTTGSTVLEVNDDEKASTTAQKI